MGGHVFISYGSENGDEAEALCALIESRGVKVWIAPRDVRPGLDYSEALQAAIESCLAFVVLVTDMANKSPYVRAETEMAFSNSKPIFPVRMSDIKPAAGLAFFLKIRHWTDAYGKGRDASLERLVAELEGLAGIAPQAAPAPIPAPAPAPAPPAAAAAAPPADTGLTEAAIGPKAAYYLARWRAMDERGKTYDWNWAACLLNFCWFGWRKMWLAAAGIALLYIVTTPLLDPTDKLVFRIIAFSVVGLSCVTGGWGNWLYRRQIERLVAATAGMSPQQALDHVKARGGTSVGGVIGAIVGTLVLGTLLQLAFPLQRPAQPQAPAEAAAPAAPMLDQAYLVGRWTDTGDCNNVLELTADGRFIAQDGGAGLWQLEGDQLTATGPSGSIAMRIAPIDQNSMTVTTADGQSGASTRC